MHALRDGSLLMAVSATARRSGRGKRREGSGPSLSSSAPISLARTCIKRGSIPEE